jgi:hypothetical protein
MPFERHDFLKKVVDQKICFDFFTIFLKHFPF